MSKNELIEQDNDMLPQYHFDYGKVRPNRFAQDIAEGGMVALLEPDLV